MGDLAEETAVWPVDEGRYRARLSQAWEIWGPMGGYVAAVAFRAAGAISPFVRPASFFCHYLGVAAFDEVDIEVSVLRAAKTACSLRVSMTQGGRPILEGAVWAVGDVHGLEHDVAVPPDVPGQEALRSAADLFPDPPPFGFWRNFTAKPVTFSEVWPPAGPMPPVWQQWCRFEPTATFADPWVDAARSVILIDVQSWPAASRLHAWAEPPFIAPSLDLYVAFHRPEPTSAWLLADGYAPVAADGLIGWTGRLWSEGRRLVASGGGQALCRRVNPG